MKSLAEFRNEPLIDWSRKDNFQKMSAAIAAGKNDLGKIYPIFIGDKYRTTGQLIPSLNPADFRQTVGWIASATEDLAAEAVEIALRAWQRWRRVPYNERAQVLFRAAELMRQRRFNLAALAVLETGKSWKEADGDVAEAIDYLEFYGRSMLELSEPRLTQNILGERNESCLVPRGVIAVIGVWNFPFAINCGMISASLVTGNAVVFKPASASAVAGWQIVEILRRAGIPEGVLSFVPGSGAEVGEALVKHDGVIGIAITGSKETGFKIQKTCAQYPCRYGFKEIIAGEFGGKGKIIIDNDADLDEAVKGARESAFEAAGQKCSAGSMNIVLDGIYDRFIERLVEATKSIRVGRPEDPSTFMGPLITEGQLKSVSNYVEIGKQEARLAYKGEISSELMEQGYFHAPVIFADVLYRARIAQEEIFGPVLAVVKAKDIEQAIAMFNDSEYALTGGIFSRLPSNCERAALECDAGNFYVNRKITGALVQRQPFGGWKYSGVGSKAGSPKYLLRFMYEKTITENIIRRGFAPVE